MITAAARLASHVIYIIHTCLEHPPRLKLNFTQTLYFPTGRDSSLVYTENIVLLHGIELRQKLSLRPPPHKPLERWIWTGEPIACRPVLCNIYIFPSFSISRFIFPSKTNSERTHKFTWRLTGLYPASEVTEYWGWERWYLWSDLT